MRLTRSLAQTSKVTLVLFRAVQGSNLSRLCAGTGIEPAAIHGHGLNRANSNHHRGGVVGTICFNREAHQFARYFAEVFVLRSDARDVAVLHSTIESVTTEDQAIAWAEADGIGVRGDEELRTQGTGEHVARLRCFGIGRGHETELALLVDPGVVLGDGNGPALANVVAARVAHMRDESLIVTERAGDDGRGHVTASPLAHQSLVVHGGVGMLNQPREKTGERGVLLALGEFVADDLNGFGGGDLAEVRAAHTVGESKEPPAGARLLAGAWLEVSGAVLVIGSYFAGVGRLAELDFQHASPKIRATAMAGSPVQGTRPEEMAIDSRRPRLSFRAGEFCL